MNRKIKAYQALIYIVAFWLAAALLLLGPGKLLDSDRMVAGNEAPAGTAQVRLDQQIQQVLIAEGSYLRYLDLYVTSSDSIGKYYHLLVYDENNEILINREFELAEAKVPGFVRIPLGIETQPNTAYVWQLQGTDTPMDLAWENTGETGLTCFGNYYVLADGQTSEQTAQNIVMRLVYTDSPAAWKVGCLMGALCAAAFLLCAGFVYLAQKKQKLNKKVPVRYAVWATAAPALLFGTVFLLYAVFVQNLFGGKADDKLVYGLGIGIAFLFFAWVLVSPRTKKHFMPLGELCRKRWADGLQVTAFAGMLLGGIHYMNALYQVQQDTAFREVFFWTELEILSMALPTMMKSGKNRLWAAAAVLAGIGRYVLWTASDGAPEKAALAGWESAAAALAVLLLGALVGKIRTRTLVLCRVNRFYAGALAALFALLCIFSNGRGWTVYTAAVFGLYYLFYLGWEHRERLLSNFCDGVVLNFALAALFCFARRPFRAWVYSRYNFVFHTVTITAAYLTLVVCVLTVRLFSGLKEKKRLADLWGTLLLYGMAVSFLFLTLSRTGYLAVLVMSAVLLVFVPFFVYRQSWKGLIREVLCMAAAFVLCLPVTYSGVRLLPALYNDPYIYEVEDSAAAIHKDDPKDSNAYMSVSYFKYVMENKLLSDASELFWEAETLLCAGDGLRVESETLVASTEDGVSDVDEFSNGRIEIFKAYIENWNLTGHAEMGVTLPDGSTSVHAHNSYLQVIHDHGMLTGAVYVAFGVLSALMMFSHAQKNGEKEKYAVLPLAVFIGFAVAGLVEWLFHPCNPLGFSALIVLAPLFVQDSALEKRKRQNEETV